MNNAISRRAFLGAAGTAAMVAGASTVLPHAALAEANGRPILALDMYEHAYQMDYGAKATGYIDAFMNNIKWSNAAALYERYSRET